MRMKQRLKALEGAVRGGWDKVHRILVPIGQTSEQAFDACGREKIGADDLVIVRTIVEPGVRT